LAERVGPPVRFRGVGNRRRIGNHGFERSGQSSMQFMIGIVGRFDNPAVHGVLLTIERPKRAQPLQLDIAPAKAVKQPQRAAYRKAIGHRRKYKGVGYGQKGPDLNRKTGGTVDDRKVVMVCEPAAESVASFVKNPPELL